MFARDLLATLTLLFSISAFATDYAVPPISLRANEILPAEQLQGENFTVATEVRNDGLINFYTLDTHYGRFTVESTAKLRIRVDELNALSVMEKLERTDVFKDSVVKGVKATGEGVKELVTDPVDTSKEMIKGTGQFFSNIGHALVSDDPDQDNALKVALGYDAAKRQFAYEFGINPYSDFEPVTDRLGEIARAAVAGGITPKLALGAIDAGIATAARISGTMRGMQKLVRDNPPNKLRDINQEKLRAMGISEELSNAFLDNYNFDPYEETLLVGELESMPIEGRAAFISRADLATSKPTAIYFRTVAQMMGGYHRNIEPAQAVHNTVGVLNLQRKTGGRVLLAPVDDVFWTKELAAKVDKMDQALAKNATVTSKEVWITGRFDGAARKEFEQRGWKVVENAENSLTKP